MKRRRRLRPFTLPHFKEYAARMTLDNGAPFELEDYEAEIMRPILAGVREVWVILPESNGKTTLLACAVLYHADYTPAPWVPIGAASRDQAEIMYSQAAGFIERSKGLQKRFRAFDGYRKIMSLRNGGKGIKVYAAVAGTGDGVIPTMCVVDEGHRHKDLELYRTWNGKFLKRGSQIVMTSTAGEPGSDFEETRDRIRDSANSRRRRGACLRATGDDIVMIEYKVSGPDKARDLRAVKAANPSPMITRAGLKRKLASPTLDYGEDWLRRTCNIPARHSRAAITDKEFDEAQTRKRIPEGEIVDVGLDIAWKWDTTALIPLWWKGHDFRLFGDPHVLVPPRDGTMLSSRKIKDAFEELKERNPIRLVAMDREKGDEIAQWLEGELGVEEVVDYGNTDQPAALAYERFMEGLREHWIKHTGHTDLRRHAMNAIARPIGRDKVRFDRPISSRHNIREQDRRVIDCLTAASNVHSVAVAVATAEPETPLNIDDYRITVV